MTAFADGPSGAGPESEHGHDRYGASYFARQCNSADRRRDQGDGPVKRDVDKTAQVSDVASRLTKLEAHIAQAEVTMQRVLEIAGDVCRKIDAVMAVLDVVAGAVKKRSVVDDKVREHEEKHFRDEILGPLLLQHIRILDRLDEDRDYLQSQANQTSPSRIPTSQQMIERTINVREADRIDVYQILQQFEVTRFRPRVGDAFDPATQKVKEQRPASKTEPGGSIAACLRPGYHRRRDHWLVRPALVAVYRNEVTKRKDAKS
ncbi:Protein GrpE [Phycisphaerae bacterium RAS2]|nr:Protein GrpE [Phycisphaerae bacterium RAS2]